MISGHVWFDMEIALAYFQTKLLVEENHETLTLFQRHSNFKCYLYLRIGGKAVGNSSVRMLFQHGKTRQVTQWSMTAVIASQGVPWQSMILCVGLK